MEKALKAFQNMFIALLVIGFAAIVTLVVVFSYYEDSSAKKDLCKSVIIEHHIEGTDSCISYIDWHEMEHNSLIGRSKNTSVYLDNTSPVTDTLHIYIYYK